MNFQELSTKLKDHLKCSKGSMFFTTSHSLNQANSKAGILIEQIVGKQYFLLEMSDELILSFYYSIPGNGTQVASIDLKTFPTMQKTFITFNWSSEMISLSVGAVDSDTPKMLTVEGVRSATQFQIGDDGSVYHFDDGINSLDVSLVVGDKKVFSPTAIKTWENIKTAIDILGTGKSDMGFIHENVVTNLSISTMVTGFETYFKKRFLELESESISPNIDNLVKSFVSKWEMEKGIIEVYKSEALKLDVSFLNYFVNKKRRINFQNFDDLKKAFKKAYNMDFSSNKFNSEHIITIRKILRFRHKIIHVSPLIGILNQEEFPDKELEFSNELLKLNSLKVFDEFINTFHTQTLKLD